MIIPRLIDYYDRLAEDQDSDIAPFGWSRQKIKFIVTLTLDGKLHSVDEPPGDDAKAKKRFTLVVPGQSKPSGSGINPCFLWDNEVYMLGVERQDKDPSWSQVRFKAFRDRLLGLEAQINDTHFSAVCSFLRSWQPGCLDREATPLTGFGIFRVIDPAFHGYVHEREAVRTFWTSLENTNDGSGTMAPSAVSGRFQTVARLHEPKIKGVMNAQSSGALLVSFNDDAYLSYGKEQGYNAPVSERDAFRYCTALNRLLANPRRVYRIGGTTVVYWASAPHPVEDITGAILSSPEDEETARRLEACLDSAVRGLPSDFTVGSDVRFFILGLSPNAARLAVRYWIDTSVGEFMEHLKTHALALTLAGAPGGYRFPSIRDIVAETVPLKAGWPDEDRVSPTLAGETARAVLTGAPYPQGLLSSVLRRARIDGGVSANRKLWMSALHRRAAIVRGCLCRNHALNQEALMSLDPSYPSVPYQLGRLFAVLEKTQFEALGEVNASLKDKFFGAASGTPVTAFPRLLRIHAHHLAKIEHPGRRINLERLAGSICDQVPATRGFPSHLTLEEQGLFFLGYYQQRQDLYAKKAEADSYHSSHEGDSR